MAPDCAGSKLRFLQIEGNQQATAYLLSLSIHAYFTQPFGSGDYTDLL